MNRDGEDSCVPVTSVSLKNFVVIVYGEHTEQAAFVKWFEVLLLLACDACGADTVDTEIESAKIQKEQKEMMEKKEEEEGFGVIEEKEQNVFDEEKDKKRKKK